MVGAGTGIDAGAVRHHNAPLRDQGAEFRSIVAGEARGADVQPLQFPGTPDAVQVRLAEGDVGKGERRIGLGLGEYGGDRLFRKQDFMWCRTIHEKAGMVGTERRI